MSSEAGAKLSDLTLSGEINAHTEHADAAPRTAFAERRAKPRIREAFPARVRGLDSDGLSFDFKIGLENISSGGVYLRLPRMLNRGAELTLVVRFSNSDPAATAALRGSVLRVEPGLDGLNGIALAIERYEFV